MSARRPRPGQDAPVRHASTLHRLQQAIADGDTAAEHAARWELVMIVRGLVFGLVRQNSQHSDDIASALLLRLADAMHKWSPPRGALTTFARAVVTSALSDGRAVRNIVGPVVTVPCVHRRLIRLYHRDGLAAAAAQVNRTPEAARRLLAVSQTNLDTSCHGQHRDLLHEVIPGTDTALDDALASLRTARRVRAAVEALPRYRRAVVRRFYGLGCRQESLTIIAGRYGVSRQRIAQIRADAVATLHTTLSRD